MVPRELAHGNPSFSARAELSRKACAPTSELAGGGEIVVPRELAHGNPSFSARAELNHKACAPTSELGSQKQLTTVELQYFAFALDIVPQHKTVEIIAGCKENTTFSLLRQAISEPDIVLGLRPAWNQEHVDHDPFLGA